jgi:hypothetical protein
LRFPFEAEGIVVIGISEFVVDKTEFSQKTGVSGGWCVWVMM